jgi:ABC-type lipoprotein export system ATPase subunit
MPHSPPIIALQNVSKQFRAPDGQMLPILENISLEIKSNQTISITGESGCGKSTLLNLIGGLDSPTAGSIFWNQSPIHALQLHQLAALRQQLIGFVFQNSNLIPELTALENILFPCRIAGKNLGQFRSRAMNLLRQLNVKNQAHQIPEKLSGGERQRIAIARALILSPQLVVADEPTGNLDEKNAAEVIDLLLHLSEENHSTLLLVTHNSSFVRKMQCQLSLQYGHLIPIF